MFFYNQRIKYLLLSFILFSCNSYQKMLNSKETAPKLKAAQNYYDNGEYRRANRLYEQIIPSYRGKPQAQRLIYFFANSHYQLGNYYLAAYQFESFVKSFPRSEKLDEANFMIAKCYYMLSPIYSLDQENTNEAMEKLPGGGRRLPRYRLFARRDSEKSELLLWCPCPRERNSQGVGKVEGENPTS